jgi:O-antigen/teichoic acid export membrane protein
LSGPTAQAPERRPEAESIRAVATRGAIWVTLTSAAAIPLAYYRSWVLGRFGTAGEVVGEYAIILLFIQIVITFVLFGGATAVTNFLPKIERADQRAGFAFTYGLLSMVLALICVALINVRPELISLLIRKPVDPQTLRILSVLVPAIILAQVSTFCLAGLMEFRLSSVLAQAQLLLVCTLASTAWLLFPEFLYRHAVPVLAATVGAANTLVFIVGGWKVLKRLGGVSFRFYLPPNFWRFTGFVHLNSLATFAYQSIDQVAILAVLGKSELGAYFVLLQCAQLITFVPQRIGQVMLASFSHLVARGTPDELRSAYARLCRMILILSTPTALFLIAFSFPIASVFGVWSGERHLYLLALAAAVQLGALGSVNSMLIMVRERTGLFLLNSIVLISIQLGVTLLMLGRWGAYAVIAGKAAGILSGQAGLFSIVRWQIDGVKVPPPREFWIAQIVALAAAAVAFLQQPLPIPAGLVLFLGATALFLRLIRFRRDEIVSLIRARRSPGMPA